MWLVIVGGLALLVGFFWLERANEIFYVSVRAGRCLVVRGRIPASLLDGLADVAARAKVQHGSIKAVKSEGHARLVTSGIDDGTTQRMRNVFGHHPVQKLRAAPLPGKRNLGQVLGFAWLAWLLMQTGRRG
jgi:hypothetical protein